MREVERSFSQSVEEFLEVYPSYIEQVRPELNGLFREEDYPSAEKLRAKFGVKLEVLPFPVAMTFESRSQRKNKRGWREKSTRVYVSRSTVGPRTCGPADRRGHHMVDKLNDPESRFHASLITNGLDLVDLLPRLNVNQDEELNRFAAEIKVACATTAHMI